MLEFFLGLAFLGLLAFLFIGWATVLVGQSCAGAVVMLVGDRDPVHAPVLLLRLT